MPPLIELDGLAKSYPGSAPAVAELSLTVAEGEIFGLLGPNGAGKTTAISMLSCLLAPSRGKARIAGHDVVAEAFAVRRIIGLVPQDLALYPTLSASDNLVYFGSLYGLGGRALRQRVGEALAMVGLAERAHDAIDKLSGGMRRRVNIAAGLLHRPRVLFLDEPTVGVDPQSRNFIFEGVEALKRAGLTVIYTTHYMEKAERLCDRVAIMDRGRLIALDTPRALIEAHGGTIVIGVGEGQIDAVAPSLSALEAVTGVVVADACVSIKSPVPARVLGRAIDVIAGAGIDIRSVDVLGQNLEAVFLDLTGRRLRD